MAQTRSPVTVELLYFHGCPHWKAADRHLRELAPELRFRLEHRVVTGPEDAEAARFRGSPTILVNGRDPFAQGDEAFGLSCRVYRTAGGPAGSPTIEQLRSALDA
jgi:hypothetical protein